MIAKGASIAHGYNAIAYGLGKDGALEVCRDNLSGANAQEVWQEMQIIANQNQHCQRNVLRFELSPTVEDGQKLTTEDWCCIAQDFMCKMGLDQNHQWLAVLHTDAAHRHIHIYANRIDFNGKAYKDNYLSMKSGRVGREIAQERGLTTAMAVHHEKQRALEPLRQQILAAHRAVTRAGMTPKQYQSLMEKQGITVVFNESKSTGRITGMSYRVNETQIKASAADRSLSYNKLFGIKHETTKFVKISPRQLLTRSRPSVGSLLPSGSISMQLAKMFGQGIVRYAKPEEKEQDEELTL